MGHIFRRKDRGLTWYADYVDRSGERCKPSLRTTDKKVAAAKLRGLELSTTDSAPHQTEALDVALNYFVTVHHAASPTGTVSCYTQKACHLERLLGGTPLDLLTGEAIERYIAARLAEGAHTHSVHKELVVLRGTLKSARKRDRFHGAMDIVPPFRSRYEPRRVFLTPDQFFLMTEQLVVVRPNSKPAALARREARKNNRMMWCLLIALASPRFGEVEAMRWEDHVDFARSILQIPKGKTIWRAVAMHPILRAWLWAMRQDAGPVVEPWHMVRRDMRAACLRAGVPQVTPNDLRRTFASWLKQAGVDSMIVARLLGHKTTRMVDWVYGVLDEATLAGAMTRLPGGGFVAVPTAPAPSKSGDAGGTKRGKKRVTAGTGGKRPSGRPIATSVEESALSSVSEVPRAGVEPAARGFSGLALSAPKRCDVQPLLRLVK